MKRTCSPARAASSISRTCSSTCLVCKQPASRQSHAQIWTHKQAPCGPEPADKWAAIKHCRLRQADAHLCVTLYEALAQCLHSCLQLLRQCLPRPSNP